MGSFFKIQCVCYVAYFITEVVRGKKASAAHACIYITLVFLHDFGRNVVGNHAFCSTFCCKFGQIIKFAVFMYIAFSSYVKKLREGRGNEYAFGIRQTGNALVEYFFYKQCKVILRFFIFCVVDVHIHRYKRRLSISSHNSNDLILNRLDCGCNIFFYAAFCHFFDLFFCCC